MTQKNPIILVQNNTDNTQPVSLFTTIPNLFGSINGNLIYQWNVTAQSLAQLTNVAIQVKTPGSQVYVTLTADIGTSDLQGILDALNSLNVGPFRTMVQGVNVFIYTYNSLFIFGNLDINQGEFTWKTSGGLMVFSALVSTVTLVYTNISTSVVLSNFSNPTVTAPEFIPTVAAVNYPHASLNEGDIIELHVAVAAGPSSLSVTLKENGTTIFSGGAVNGIVVVFHYTANAVYSLTAQSL